MTIPRRVRPWGRAHVPVLTGAESAAFDRRAIEEVGVPQPVLMENAGRGAAQVVERIFPRGRVVALVGSGNNGGDAIVALRSLAEWGRPVTAVLVGDRPPDEPVLHGWELDRVDDGDGGGKDMARTLDGADVIIDGILGTGIKGAPRERQARAIAALEDARSRGRSVVALDIPSGVDADTGAVPGAAVTADVTVCFGWPKLGVLLHPGRARSGRVVVLDIGFPPLDEDQHGADLVTPAWAEARRPGRQPDTHKNRVGALLVVAGRSGMAGAAVMAARAALRTGAGLVRVASVEENRTVLQAAAPEAVFVDVADGVALREAMEASSALVLGPGLGTDGPAERIVTRVLQGPELPVVVDADALNLVAEGRPRPRDEVLGVLASRTILTPHPGEMARLSGLSTHEIAADRVGIARRFAESHGCALLLKGFPSVVAAPGRPVLVDAVATSDLATGGMGDVLAGCAGAFLARGVDPATAGALGLHSSGRAAALSGPGGVLPEDVIAHLPDALREEGPGDTDLDLPFLRLDLDPAR